MDGRDGSGDGANDRRKYNQTFDASRRERVSRQLHDNGHITRTGDGNSEGNIPIDMARRSRATRSAARTWA